MNIEANTPRAALKTTVVTTLAALALVGSLLLAPAAAFAATTQADGTTTLTVKLALLNKLGTDSLRIDVTTNAGAVNLTGMVHKRETKELAETVAKTVAGVKSVDNDLTLEAMEANPSKTSAAAGEAEAELKDTVLETKVRMALVDKLGSDGFDISTEVASGVVTLAFHKDFVDAHRQKASAVVKAVDGVTKVIIVDQKS